MTIKKRELRNEPLALTGVFHECLYPIQASGKIGSNRFFFTEGNEEWTFSVADENSNFSEPALISNEDQGFLVRGIWKKEKTVERNFKKAEKIILECAEKYTKHIKNVSKRYQDRIIAFVDILGFKKIVAQTAIDQQYFNNIIASISEIRREFIRHYRSDLSKFAEECFYDPIDCPNYKTQVLQVSDCLIISKLANVHGALEELVADISLAIHLLIENGLLCRGCIEFGKVYHTDEYIIGPAYNAAFLGEENEFFPAVSFSKELYDLGLNNRSTDKRMRTYFDQFIIQHEKKKYFIDYFNDYSDYIDLAKTPQEHYQKLKEIIEKEYAEVSHKIKGKYLWMIDQFNKSSIVQSGKVLPIHK